MEEILPVFEKVRALFQCKGVDGNIGRVQGRYRVQRTAEAFHTVGGQTGDEIHVDGLEAGVFGLLVGSQNILSIVGPPAGRQHAVLHGLGIDAHAVGTAPEDDAQLFRVQSIGPSTLYGELDAPAQVKAVVDALEQMGHLGSG